MTDSVCGLHMRWWFAPFVLLIFIAWGLALTYIGPASFDVPLLLWFRDSGDSDRIAGPQWVTTFWQYLSWLGDALPRIVVASMLIVVLLVLRRYHSAWFMTGILLSGIALSTTLKHLVGRPRPQLIAHLDTASSASFPSGHALNSTLFYVTTAWVLAPLLPKRVARWALYSLALALSLSTGVSRVALGVHYPTDVIAGWILAVTWLWLCLCVARHFWPETMPQVHDNLESLTLDSQTPDSRSN